MKDNAKIWQQGSPPLIPGTPLGQIRPTALRFLLDFRAAECTTKRSRLWGLPQARKDTKCMEVDLVYPRSGYAVSRAYGPVTIGALSPSHCIPNSNTSKGLQFRSTQDVHALGQYIISSSLTHSSTHHTRLRASRRGGHSQPNGSYLSTAVVPTLLAANEWHHGKTCCGAGVPPEVASILL